MYLFEFISVFALFMVLAAFFTPMFGGCFVLLLVFLFLGGLIVFFSLNLVWFLAIGLVIYGYGFIAKYVKWRKLPDLNQYIAAHPECRLTVGVSCSKCGSNKLTHFGLFHKASKWRFYNCNQCGSMLFRFKVL
ncbi:MAG: hypothetical protein ACK4M7_03765 [Burkholderiales bacterium]